MSIRPTFDQALREYRKLRPEQTASPFPPECYESLTEVHQRVNDARTANGLPCIPICPKCGFWKGVRGYLRFPFPLGHPYFGFAIPCPLCNGRR